MRGTTATWLCSAIVVVPGLLLPSGRDYFLLGCGILPIELLVGGIGLMGLIRIGASHRPTDLVPFRRILVPERPDAVRFFPLLLMQVLVTVPLVMAASFAFVATLVPDAPVQPLPCTVAALAIFLPTVYVFAAFDLAQREVLLAQSGLGHALRAALRLMRTNLGFLAIAFGLAFLVQFAPYWIVRVGVHSVLGFTSLNPLTQATVLQAVGGLVYILTLPLGSAIVTHAWLQIRPAGDD